MRIEEGRLKALNILRENGIDPYPHKYQITHTIQEARNKPIGAHVKTAGRIRAIRKHGRAFFADLWDEGTKIQTYFKIDILGEDRFKLAQTTFDTGDIIGVEGETFLTRKGELTILVKSFTILSKALNTPPKEWYGIRDKEIRYRKRYLDILINQEVRQAFETRFRIISEIRNFLNSKGFIEVETPILQPIYGGASARPFKTHVNALGQEWYLRISPELYLKRLIIAGFNKIYEIGKVFRNEDIDVSHNPEFTIMELYWAYADYNDIMNLTEELIEHLALNIIKRETIRINGNEIHLTRPFKRITMYEALRKIAGIDPERISDEEIKEIMRTNEITLRGGYSRGLALAEIFEKLCEDELIQPTFILDHPIETTPLCKPHRSKPGLIERFELYINGIELANAYTELNDPILQERLLIEQAKRRELGDEEAHMYDADFVEALSYGMPPTGGLGIGIDRLVMALLNLETILETVISPRSPKYHKP